MNQIVKKTKEQFLQEYHDCWHKENASLELKPMTLEGCVVRISDVIFLYWKRY